MYNRYIRIRMWMIVAALLVVTGCGTSPQPTFYRLTETASTQLSGLERGLAVGVGPVNVAPYLDRPQIVIRGAGHKLELSEFNRWVEPLTDSISRVIIINLSNRLESTRIYMIPRRNKTIPLEFRIEIDIARFDGKLGGDALLVARWTLYDRRNEPLVTKVSIISELSGVELASDEPPSEEVFDKLIAAQNRCLQKLSGEIGDAINASR